MTRADKVLVSVFWQHDGVFFLFCLKYLKKEALKDERRSFLCAQNLSLHFSSMIVCHIDGEGTNWAKTFHVIWSILSSICWVGMWMQVGYTKKWVFVSSPDKR